MNIQFKIADTTGITATGKQECYI